MSYVPTPIVTPGMNVSPRAQDLARTLEKAVEEYRHRNPSLSDEEIRQALMVMSQNRSAAAPRILAIVLGLGLAVLGLVAFFFLQEGGSAGGASGAPISWILIGLMGIAGVAGVIAALSRRGP
jgi:hypothetical protein